MPAPLPSAPWLQPPDTTGNFMRGAALGQQAGESQARLAQAAAALQAQTAHANAQLKQQSDRTAMEFEVRKQEHERETLMAQQKMEIEQQYRQSQIGLAKQKADEAAKMNAAKLKQAADMGAARMEYDSILKGIESDTTMSEDQKRQARSNATYRLGPRMSGAGANASVSASLNAASKMAPPPQTTWNPPTNGAPGYVTDPRGVPHFVPKQSAPIVDPTKHALLASYTSALTKALDEQNLAESGGKKKEIESADRLVQLRRSQIAELSGTNAPSGSGAVAHYDPASKKLVFAKGTQPSVSPSDKQQATLPQTKAQEQETPVNFDQYHKAIMSLPLDKRGGASYKATEKVVSELVKAAGIPKEWDRLRKGGSKFFYDTEDTLLNAMLKGDSHGITAKDVQGIFDAQSPETQAQILGKALKAAGVSAPSGDATDAGSAQAPAPQGEAQSPYE